MRTGSVCFINEVFPDTKYRSTKVERYLVSGNTSDSFSDVFGKGFQKQAEGFWDFLCKFMMKNA